MTNIFDKEKYYFMKSSHILKRCIKHWNEDPDNEGYDPHFHIKMYKKLKRDEYFDVRKKMAYERLIRDCQLLNINLEQPHIKKLPTEQKIQEMNDKLDINSEEQPVFKKVRRNDRRRCKSREKFGETNSSSTFKPDENMYEVLSVEEVYLDDDIDVSLTIENIKDEKVSISIRDEGKNDELNWLPFTKQWVEKGIINDITKIPEIEPEYEDMMYLRSVENWNNKDIKINVHDEFKKKINYKHNDRVYLDNRRILYNGYIQLPNIIKNGENLYQLAFFYRDQLITDVKYVHSSEYNPIFMKYACEVDVNQNEYEYSFK